MGNGNPPAETLASDLLGAGTLPSYQDSQRESTSIISGTADATDDGRISVNLDSKLARVFSKFIPVQDERDTLDPPPNYSIQTPWMLPMNIVIQVVGSRGDIQPFVALGSELRKSGHRVRIATHDLFEDFVKDAGLEFYPIGDDPAELMAYMVKNPGLFPNMKSLREGEIKRKRKMIAEILQGCWKSCIEPDPNTNAPFIANAVIANPVSFAHVHCAEALSIPLHMVFTMPWSPTRAFPHPLANIQNTSTDPRLANYLSYGLVQVLTWQGLGDIINTFRTTLDLHPLPLTEAPFILDTLKIPTTYIWSPALVPKPLDWPSHIDVSGFVFRSQSTYTYTPPPALTEFLAAGPPPIYIGFGSIVIPNPAELLSKLLSAIEQTGIRAIISNGWSNLSSHSSTTTTSTQNPNILFLPDYPHEHLFPSVTATIHHGGSGTTAISLLAGKPTFIIPFFGDQPFWGDRVAASGAGPTPIPYKEVTVEKLVDAIGVLLAPEKRVAAEGIAEVMKREDGVAGTVNSFHRHLGRSRLACDLVPTLPAVYEVSLVRPTERNTVTINRSASQFGSRSRNRNQNHADTVKLKLKLSSSAVEVLLNHDKIKTSQLRLYEPNKIIVENRRWDPFTSMSSSAVRVGVEMVKGVNGLWYEPWRVSVEAKEKERESEKGKGKGKREEDKSKSERECEWPLGSNDAEDSNDDLGTERVDTTISSSQCGTRTQSKRTQKQNHTKQASSITSEILTAGAMSLPRLTGVMTKSFLVDTPYAVAEGFRNTPRLYGEEVPDHASVTGWKSGMMVGGKESSRGLTGGLVDLFVQPYKGAKENGAVGLAMGIGKGVIGTFTKLGTAGFALWAYPVQGCWRSVYNALHGETRRKIFSARRIHDLYYAERDLVDDSKVPEVFDKLQNGL